MKITIPRQDLFDAVNKVKSIVAARSALPILSHILLEADDNQIKLSATDLKVSIECTVPCTVESAGTVTISCQRIAGMLAELPDQDVTLELSGNNVINLTCGKIESKLYSMASDEFPPIRDFEGVEPLNLDQRTLKKVFTKTSFGICHDQARYNLTGLLVEIKDGKMVVVSTDGRRMSLYQEEENIPAGLDIKVIVPGKMVQELERLLEDEGQVQVYIDESQAAFIIGSTRLVTALIEGNFPNYEMVIPKKHDKEVVVSTSALTEAVRRTRTMTNEKFNSVRFGVEPGVMTLTVVTPEVGEYHEELPVDYQGEGLEIAFNPDFILDVLRHIETDQSILVLKDTMSPGLLKPATDSGVDQYLNVVMPIRI